MQARGRVVLLWCLLPWLIGCGDAGSSGTQRDLQLVGHWRRTVDGNTGVEPSRLIVDTDIYCTMDLDGSFEYGATVAGAVDPRFRQFVGSGNTVRGLWKSAGQVLYSKPDGSQQWIVLGRYSISGSRMVLHGGGRPEYWER